jgi:hypothetical protein
MYNIHNRDTYSPADGIIVVNEISLTSSAVLNASPADEEYPGASCKIPGSPQVQCYNGLKDDDGDLGNEPELQ